MGVVVYEPLCGFPHTLVLIGAKIPVDLFGICGFGSHNASRHLLLPADVSLDRSPTSVSEQIFWFGWRGTVLTCMFLDKVKDGGSVFL